MSKQRIAFEKRVAKKMPIHELARARLHDLAREARPIDGDRQLDAEKYFFDIWHANMPGWAHAALARYWLKATPAAAIDFALEMVDGKATQESTRIDGEQA